MLIKQGEITIRNATAEDANVLCKWWNDGAVMAHAGFPNGIGTSEEEIAKSLEADRDDTCRRHIIEIDTKAIGEMNYRNKGHQTAEIGIKICENSYQNKGYGKRILLLFINGLLIDLGYDRIVLDTNSNNKRARHVYQSLGFTPIKGGEFKWKDQLGRWQRSISYEYDKGAHTEKELGIMNMTLENYVDKNIQTERLSLKPIDESVAQQIFEHFTDEVTTYMCPSAAKKLDETLAFIHAMQDNRAAKKDFVYSIHNKKTDDFIGCVGLHQLDTDVPELGIWTKISAHGNGYGREAVGGLIDLAKLLNYKKLKYPVDCRNIPSKKIPIFYGGKLVDKNVTVNTPDGRVLDEEIYHIILAR